MYRSRLSIACATKERESVSEFRIHPPITLRTIEQQLIIHSLRLSCVISEFKTGERKICVKRFC